MLLCYVRAIQIRTHCGEQYQAEEMPGTPPLPPIPVAVTHVQNSVPLNNDSQPLLPWPQTPTTAFPVSELTSPVTSFKYNQSLAYDRSYSRNLVRGLMAQRLPGERPRI